MLVRSAWILLVTLALLVSGCILPATPYGQGDDDDDASDDDDDDDDDTTPTDDDDDDTTPTDDDDDTTPTDDDDDDVTPDFPIGDYVALWSWVYGYSDPSIGAEHMAYVAYLTIAQNAVQSLLELHMYDGAYAEVCVIQIQGGGPSIAPQYSVATGTWNLSNSTISSDDCYQDTGNSYPYFLALAPKMDAFSDIATQYGISVADQVDAEQEALTELGTFGETDYFAYVGTSAADMSPLGFVLEM